MARRLRLFSTRRGGRRLSWKPEAHPVWRKLAASPAGLPTIDVADVPPGTYVVRVRGVNAAGQGLASAKIVVVAR
jgi:hypothetical protein